MLIAEIQDLVVLHSVVRQGSYSKAADELGLSPSRVSRVVSGLEDRLGVRLVQRTTRKLSLTEIGRAFCDQTGSILRELDEAEAEVHTSGLAPRGKLRISLPTLFGKVFSTTLLASFARRFPGLRLELNLMDRYADLVEESVDLALRVGPVNDPRLSFQRLCTNRRLLVASPAYLERFGQPRSVADLAAHSCILFDGFEVVSEWRLVGQEGPLTARVSGRVVTNNMQVLAGCALEGLGIAPGATMAVGQHLLSGELVRVLPEYEFEPTAVFAVYPTERQLSTKVRAAVQFMVEQLGDPAPWDQCLLGRVCGFNSKPAFG